MNAIYSQITCFMTLGYITSRFEAHSDFIVITKKYDSIALCGSIHFQIPWNVIASFGHSVASTILILFIYGRYWDKFVK